MWAQANNTHNIKVIIVISVILADVAKRSGCVVEGYRFDPNRRYIFSLFNFRADAQRSGFHPLSVQRVYMFLDHF